MSCQTRNQICYMLYLLLEMKGDECACHWYISVMGEMAIVPVPKLEDMAEELMRLPKGAPVLAARS